MLPSRGESETSPSQSSSRVLGQGLSSTLSEQSSVDTDGPSSDTQLPRHRRIGTSELAELLGSEVAPPVSMWPCSAILFGFRSSSPPSGSGVEDREGTDGGGA